MASHKYKLSCGFDLGFEPNLQEALEARNGKGFDFVCLNLVNPMKKVSFGDAESGDKLGDETNPDFMLMGQEWCSLIVGKISKWLTLHSDSNLDKANMERALIQELNFAAYLSLPAIWLNIPSPDCASLAKCIYTHLLTSHHNMSVWVNVPMTCTTKDMNEEGESNQMKRNNVDTWHWWNKFRSLCNHHQRIGLALEITADLPDKMVVNQWLGEPVRSVVLPTSIFLTDKKGNPVLSRSHQALMMHFFRQNCQIVITGSNEPPFGLKVYKQYIAHLQDNIPPLDQYDSFSRGYEDYLQAPLQPLMDNLESATYETFEKDPIKYYQYQEAIFKCLAAKSKNMDGVPKLVVMVLGAGRGPLVRATLQAAAKANISIKCYAVEKNANAVVTLELLKRKEWVNDDVTIVSCDMREWEAPELADVIVSELLGSFGDNELSPECLDGAERFLKPDAVSIPTSYTSYLCPVSSQKLYNEVIGSALLDTDKPKETAFETPYVVRMHNYNELAQPKEVFTFTHPKSKAEQPDQKNASNSLKTKDHLRNICHAEMTFNVSSFSILHGFAGYFHSTLYDDVCISIVPKTHSPGMFSWFPIFFPLQTPIAVKENDNIKFDIWRCCSASKVWYEWAVAEPSVSPIHNPAGRSYAIGL